MLSVGMTPKTVCVCVCVCGGGGGEGGGGGDGKKSKRKMLTHRKAAARSWCGRRGIAVR